MDQYLQKRADGKSGTYYVCYPVPAELHTLVGRRYERKSTGTANQRDARRVAAELVAGFERGYQVLYAQVVSPNIDANADDPPAVRVALSETLIASLCERWRISHLNSDDEERDEGIDDTDLALIATYAASIELQARELAAMGRKAPSFVHVRMEACDWAETVGYGIAENDAEIMAYVRKFASEKFAVSKALVARNKGEPVLTPPIPQGFNGATLLDYLPIWLETHVAGLAPKTKILYVGRIKQFVRYLSAKFPELSQMPLRAIEGRHVQGFVSFLLHEEQLHPGSIRDGHLPALRSIFQFARADEETMSDPCANVKLSKISKKEEAGRARPRETFEVEFVNRLLQSGWYGVGKEGLLHSTVYADLASRYWIPLMLLSHGLRPIEVCQLTLADIFYSGSLLCVQVTDAQDGQTTKTAATKRGLPVHEKLLSLGFAEFAERRKKEGKPADRLFPAMAGRIDPAKWFAQQFNRYIRKSLAAPKSYTLHSFRHFWENSRRGAQSTFGAETWPKGMHFQISGREDIEREEGSAKYYGSNYTATQMAPYLSLIWNKEIELPIHYAEFEATAFVSVNAQAALKRFAVKSKKK
jgi:integrase